MISTEDRQFAHELANALNDKHSMANYMRFVRDVPRDVLTTARDRALGVRDEDVLVSRGAIFTGIINEYLNDIHAGAGH